MSLSLCEGHCRGVCGNEETCEALHICKFFIIGGDCASRSASACKFGHDIHTAHNRIVLQRWSLGRYNLEQLQSVFQQNRQGGLTVPTTCIHYNKEGGCRAKPDTKCPFMHVCTHYIMGTCKFGQKCKRSHNIFDNQPKYLLEKYAINVARSPKEVLTELRQLHDVDVEKVISPGRKSHVASPRSAGSSAVHQSTMRQRTISSSSATDDDMVEICSFFLKGRCSFGKNCRNLHRKLSCQWQIMTNMKWEDVDDQSNKVLQVNYCDPQKEQCSVQMVNYPGYPGLTVDFHSMTITMTNNKVPVRLVSTVSSVKASPSLAAMATEWRWYWKDNDGKYKEYGQTSCMSAAKSDISLETIEEEFLEDRNGKLQFTTDEHKYELDFQAMTQTNMNPIYYTKRSVHRRPVCSQDRSTRALKSDPKSTSLEGASFPAHWTKMDGSAEFVVVEVLPSGVTQTEYKQVADLFHKTMSNMIQSIKRIQNPELWDKYASKKKYMLKKLSTSPQPDMELQLFHGTSQRYIDGICEQGFDWRLSGSSVGTAYGKGSYFHRHSSYSRSYTDCNTMFVARVLVGQYTRGSSSYVRPPLLDPSKPTGKLYDSCVDDVSNPNMFIVFTHEQTYPEYLVSYL